MLQNPAPEKRPAWSCPYKGLPPGCVPSGASGNEDRPGQQQHAGGRRRCGGRGALCRGCQGPGVSPVESRGDAKGCVQAWGPQRSDATVEPPALGPSGTLRSGEGRAACKFPAKS